MGLLKGLLGCQCLRLLLRRVEKDGGTILRAPIRPLAVNLGGIVVLPENLEQVGIRHFGGVEVDFHGLGVAGAVSANLLIGWTVGVPAGIADASRDHAWNLPKRMFHSPEASCCERSLLHLICSLAASPVTEPASLRRKNLCN